MEKNIKIIHLKENTPDYDGCSDLIKFGNKYFRTRDEEGYRSWLEEIDESEYIRLTNYEEKKPLLLEEEYKKLLKEIIIKDKRQEKRKEYQELLKNNKEFANEWQDTEEDFIAWVESGE